MKHNENIEDECEDNRQLYVPLFPMRKRPSVVGLSSITSTSTTSQSTKLITQYRSLQDSIQKRDLEVKIIKELLNDKRSLECYAISQQWAEQYKCYLYQNGAKPGICDNINAAVWKFVKEEYQANPEIIIDYKNIRSNDKRSRTVEPNVMKKEQISQNTYELPLIGMKNDSYFCYMHAGLQCLLSIADLNQSIIKSVRSMITKQQLTKKQLNIIQFNKAYNDLIDQIRISTSAIKVNTLKVLLISKFHPKNQHDCHELLLYLLGQIEDEILAINKEIKVKQSLFINFIEELFKGKIQSHITCQICSNKVKTIEPFLILSLAITQSKTLESCLDDFLKEEILRDYKCSKCQATCVKSLHIAQTPTYLILHLKRFQFFPSCLKNNKPITYPLDVLHFANHTYRLKGVIVHTGNLQSGHYYSFAKRYHTWFLFNDENVTQVSKRQVLSQLAYILFYQINEIV